MNNTESNNKDTTSMEEKCPCEGRGYYYKEEEGGTSLIIPSHTQNCRFYVTPSLPEWSERFDKEVQEDKSMGGLLHNHKWLKTYIKEEIAQAEKRTLERAIEALPKYRDASECNVNEMHFCGCRVDDFNDAIRLSKDSLNKLLTNHE